ncbi:hypothetical protein ACFXP3_04645 [Streptomyces sp. NPDC059096]|uniref:hypothetical protein n=1 Tax=Streptomyces sp. NPDC059096 TaxID=3346727 RepID=UPI003686A183
MAKDSRPQVPGRLIELQRASNAARREATREAYTSEGWRPWRDAADEVQVAVTAHAAEAGIDRYELEMETKRLARQAEAETVS